MPAPLVPIPLGLVQAALARRGVRVSLKRLQQAAAVRAIPSRKERHRRVVDETDLDAIAAYFRDHPVKPHRSGAAAVVLAGER